MKQYTDEERRALYEKVDLRVLTKQTYRPRDVVHVNCPRMKRNHPAYGHTNADNGDLGVFGPVVNADGSITPSHVHCFGAGCKWHTTKPFDGAGVLLNVFNDADPDWGKTHYGAVMAAIEKLADNDAAPVAAVDTTDTITDDQMREMYATYKEKLWGSVDLVRRICDGRGLTPEQVQRYGLAHTGRAWAIPVHDRLGNLVTMRFRRDETVSPITNPKQQARYWGLPGRNDKSLLYGLPTLPKQPWPEYGRGLVLVEGEFDTIAAQLMGLPAVSFVNGSGMKLDRIEPLLALASKLDWLAIMYDQDDGGQNPVRGYNDNGRHVKGIMEILAPFKDKCFNVRWDQRLGKDPDTVRRGDKTNPFNPTGKPSFLRGVVRGYLEEQFGV